ncbi:MAG: histidine kinase [Bacteroidetes bacterium HGW-Bacteroidetes-2]|jgi:hypothetical protein|nr:MAG: histidine kinase [Bacteroidetes bacterium HGW-Bacteroidetes-2]
MLQSVIKYIFKTIIIGLVIGFAIAGIFYLIDISSGKSIEWNAVFAKDVGYYLLYAVVLTLINGGFFDYINKRVVWGKHTKYRIVLGIIGSVVLTLIGIFFIRLFINVVLEEKTYATFIEGERSSYYVVSVLITLIIVLLFHAIHFYKELQKNKLKEQKIIAGTASAQFESLKNQIDPHFLFNSLNVLTSLIEENPENAQRFTTSLSKIYRYVLEQKDKELVSVEEELAFAKTYMDLLKMRFENSVFYEVPERLENPDAKVVPLSLQLLLENTVKHNIVSNTRPLNIRIYEKDNYLVVENDYQKKEVMQTRKGVGLQNIVNRYGIITKRNVFIEQNEKVFKVKIPILTKQINVMENTNQFNENNAYYKAQRRVKEIKEFYGNLISYCVVIPFLIFINLYTYSRFQWFWFPLFGWGLGLTIHGFSVFGYGSSWEEKKIREIMEKDEKNKKTWN